MTAVRGRLFRASVLVVLALLVVNVGSQGVLAQDSFEPNDDREQAASVETDTEIDAGLATNDYYDWYKFDVGSGDNVSVTFTNEATSSGSDISLTLYDTNGDFVDLETVEAGETIEIGYILGQSGTGELSVFDTDPAEYTFTVHTDGGQASGTDGSDDSLGSDAAQETVAPSDDVPPPEIDTASLSTYQSTAYDYSIEFPNEWSVNPTDPSRVSIAPDAANAQLQIGATVTDRSYTLEELSPIINETFATELENFEEIDRREVTLPSGQQALLIDSTYESSSGVGTLRSKFLVLSVGNTLYDVELVFLAEDYNDDLDAAGNTIVESFTIGTTATATTTQTATATPTETTTATPTSTETATSTPTETTTGTAETTGTNGSSSGDSGTGSGGAETTSTFGPGFGLVGAVIALLAVAFLAVRRR